MRSAEEWAKWIVEPSEGPHWLSAVTDHIRAIQRDAYLSGLEAAAKVADEHCDRWDKRVDSNKSVVGMTGVCTSAAIGNGIRALIEKEAQAP